MVLVSLYTHMVGFTMIQEFSNIPMEHTPDPEPTVYEGIPLGVWGGLGYAPGVCWGSLRYEEKTFGFASGDVFFFLAALKFHHHE